MKNEQALYLLFSLSDDSPLIERIRRKHFPEAEKLLQEHRLWYGNRDAALGSHLSSTYFRARRRLPKHIVWSAVLRAHRCLEAPAETRRTDPVCHEVLAFGHPLNMQAQAILKGYLCSGLTYQAVATRVGKSAEFVTLYAHLFCDFPERRGSEEFVMGVLDPQSERGSFQTDLSDLVRIPDPTLRAMNIGYFCGPEVLARGNGKAYENRATDTETEVDLLRNVQRRLLVRAERKSMLGSLGSDDPEFGLLKALSQQKQNSHSNRQPIHLEALSTSEGAQLTLNGILQEQISGQLQALSGVSDPNVEVQDSNQGSNYEI